MSYRVQFVGGPKDGLEIDLYSLPYQYRFPKLLKLKEVSEMRGVINLDVVSMPCLVYRLRVGLKLKQFMNGIDYIYDFEREEK